MPSATRTNARLLKPISPLGDFLQLTMLLHLPWHNIDPFMGGRGSSHWLSVYALVSAHSSRWQSRVRMILPVLVHSGGQKIPTLIIDNHAARCGQSCFYGQSCRGGAVLTWCSKEQNQLECQIVVWTKLQARYDKPSASEKALRLLVQVQSHSFILHTTM